ncbi:MAG: phosphatidate cytidylyltransferase [Hellea sp.]|nr:phosphatidate cytidylyltransferase [Hellea sp.]
MTEAAPRQPIWKNLGTRFVSALLLAGILFLPFYFGGIFWGLTVLLLGLRGIWEWVEMTDVKPGPMAFLIPVAALGLVIWFYYFDRHDWIYPATAIATMLALIERFRRPKGDKFWAPIGVVYLLIPCLTVIGLRGSGTGISDTGFQLVFYIMLVVIAADVGAYFGGSYFKGPKLVPKLSPKKTWSGLLCGILFGAFFGGLFGLVWKLGPVNSAIIAVPIVLFSVIGDFFESAVKRRMNVKDASDLIPGHGGMLDRLDSLLMVMIAAHILNLFYPIMGLV